MYISLLLDYGDHVNFKDKRRDTALILASEQGYIKVVKILIENGANVNSRDVWGKSSLTHASLYGYIKIVKILLEYGANVNDLQRDPQHFNYETTLL